RRGPRRLVLADDEPGRGRGIRAPLRGGLRCRGLLRRALLRRPLGRGLLGRALLGLGGRALLRARLRGSPLRRRWLLRGRRLLRRHDRPRCRKSVPLHGRVHAGYVFSSPKVRTGAPCSPSGTRRAAVTRLGPPPPFRGPDHRGRGRQLFALASGAVWGAAGGASSRPLSWPLMKSLSLLRYSRS